MRLIELFKRVADWRWMNDQWAEFQVGQETYQAGFFKHMGQIFIGFGMVSDIGGWEDGNTGTG